MKKNSNVNDSCFYIRNQFLFSFVNFFSYNKKWLNKYGMTNYLMNIFDVTIELVLYITFDNYLIKENPKDLRIKFLNNINLLTDIFATKHLTEKNILWLKNFDKQNEKLFLYAKIKYLLNDNNINSKIINNTYMINDWEKIFNYWNNYLFDLADLKLLLNNYDLINITPQLNILKQIYRNFFEYNNPIITENTPNFFMKIPEKIEEQHMKFLEIIFNLNIMLYNHKDFQKIHQLLSNINDSHAFFYHRALNQKSEVNKIIKK